MRSTRLLFPVIAAMLVFYFIMPLQADIHFAAQTVETPPGSVAASTKGLQVTNPNGVRQTCSSLPEAKDGVLLGMIAPCLIRTIANSTMSLSQSMITAFQPLFYSFLTLVICLFGVKILQGERQAHAQAFSLLFKVTVAITLFNFIPVAQFDMGNGKIVPGLIPSLYGTIEDGVNIVASSAGPNGKQISCDLSKYGYGPGLSTPMVWAEMDCILGKLYGFSTGTNKNPDGSAQPNMLLASSAAGLLSGFLFGGTFGVAVFFALLGVLWSLMSLVLKTTLAIMNGYLIVCIMLIIAPLFLPLMFLKVTSNYFEKWWKAILGGILLPVIVATYSMYALLIYDQLLFQPNSLLQQFFNIDSVKNALKQNHKACDMRVTGDSNFALGSKDVNPDADTNELVAQKNSLMTNPMVQNFVAPMLGSANDACGLMSFPSFDLSQVTGAIAQGDSTKLPQDFANVFKSLIELVIMSFILMEGLDKIEQSIASLTGSGGTISALNAKSKTEQRIQTGYANMRKSMTQTYQKKNDPNDTTGVRGSDFLVQTKDAVPNAAKAFFGGVIRN